MASNDPSFDMQVFWDGRAETPEAIATRFLAMVDALQEVDAVFTLWHCGLRGPTPLETVRDKFAKVTRSGTVRSSDRIILDGWGYRFGSMTRGQPNEKRFALNGCVGATYAYSGLVNNIILKTLTNVVPDPSMVAYSLFRAIMRIMVDVWQPDYCTAYPARLLGVFDGGYFRPQWLVFLSADLSMHVGKLDAVPVVEHAPDGGLHLAATTETFDIRNAVHMAGACSLGDAIAPLNALFPAKPLLDRHGRPRFR